MKPIYREYQKGDLDPLKNLMAELGYSVELIDLENNINTIHKNGGEIFIAENQNNVSYSNSLVASGKKMRKRKIV